MTPRVAYQFGEFRFEPFNARLIRGTKEIALTAKVTQTLHLLVQHPGDLVTKEALMAAVWPDAVVHENNLNQQISALRKALGQQGPDGIIQTVPRLGYRFTVPVSVVHADAAASTALESLTDDPRGPSDTDSGAVGTRRRAAVRSIAAAIAIAAIAGGSWAVWPWYQRRTLVHQSNAALERGRELLKRGDAPAATAELQRAITLNPQNAMAFSTLAHALHKYSFHNLPRPAGATASIEAAQRAVAIDPNCANCRGSLGFFVFYHDWRWAEAETQLVEAVRLAPEKEEIRPSYALLLVATARPVAALEQIDFALSRRPYEVGWHVIRASILYVERRYADAIQAADSALAINDRERGAWEWRSKALIQLGRGEEAIKALAKSAFADHAVDLERAVLEGQAAGGLRELLRITGDWTQRPEQSWRRGAWRLLLDDVEGGLDELETAYERRNFNLMYVAVDPVYDPIRQHPRFQRLIAGMGLDVDESDRSQ